MGKKSKEFKNETRNQFRQFYCMNDRLHQMLKRLGQEPVSNCTIKLDEFERLRSQFVKSAEFYQKSNHQLKFENQRQKKAQMVFQLADHRLLMEQCLKQMTALVVKLHQKVKREQTTKNQEIKPKKKKAKGFRQQNELLQQTINMIEEGGMKQKQQQAELSPLEKDLQYKKLVLYGFQNTYFKLIGRQRLEVAAIERDLNNNKFQSLEDLKQKSPARRLLKEDSQVLDQLQQNQILDALKEIDNLIEQRMDNILQGIKMLNHNALNISQGLDNIHTKVLINLDKVNHNNKDLKSNQKRMEQASKYTSKPNCCMNVAIFALLGLLGYLIIRIVSG